MKWQPTVFLTFFWILVSFVGCVRSSCEGSSNLVRFDFTARVTDIYHIYSGYGIVNKGFGGTEIDDIFSGSVTFDLSVEPEPVVGTGRLYLFSGGPPVGINATVGSNSFQIDEFRIYIENDQSNADSFTITGQAPAGWFDNYFRIEFVDEDKVAFSDEILPQVPPELSLFESNVGRVSKRFLSYDDSWSKFTLTTLTVGTIPWKLVGHYLFSSNARDVSGFKNHGTASGVIRTADRNGIANSSYQFDGQDDHILIPNTTSLDISNFQDGYTLAAWIFPDDVSSYYRVIVGKGNNGFSIRLNRNKLEACHHGENSTGCQASNIRIPHGKWSHIAVTWDSSTGKWQMYHNGNPADYTGNMQTLTTSNEGNVAIGKDPWYDRWYFDGKIDDVHIYNRGLQASEISQLAGQ